MYKIVFYTIWSLLSMAMIACSGSGNKNGKGTSESQPTIEQVWATDPALQVPESVCFDPKTNVLYVANINGKPTDKDGNGYISVVSLDGEIENLTWIEGLDAPKGMGVFNGMLYVTNIDEVVLFGIDSAKVIQRFPCKGATFVNDIAIDKEGVVYASGMASNQIFRINDGQINVWIAPGDLERPYGLFAARDYLLIGTKDAVYKAGYRDGVVAPYIRETGPIDGLKSLGGDNYLISDWSGHVYVVNPAKDPYMILNTKNQEVNAADIEYIPEKKMLFVPTFFDNRVVAYKIEYAGY